jgi:hypothetical protein
VFANKGLSGSLAPMKQDRFWGIYGASGVRWVLANNVCA